MAEDDLICDFAETYHIYDYERLPVKTAVSLVGGLPPESRCVMRLTGQKATMQDLMLAGIMDMLAAMIFAQSDSRPPSMVDLLLGRRRGDTAGFDTPEDFEAARNKILKEARDGI